MNIPVYGSMERPLTVEEGLDELEKGLLIWNGAKIVIEYSTDEFTSVCPTTGQPDYSNLAIQYIPNKKYIESKCMKFYLWAFRDYGVHCEYLAEKIASDIKKITDCRYIKVTVDQKARGGLKLKAISERGNNQ